MFEKTKREHVDLHKTLIDLKDMWQALIKEKLALEKEKLIICLIVFKSNKNMFDFL